MVLMAELPYLNRMNDKSTAQRAFELARGGTCRSVEDIRRKLTEENYESVSAHLSGPTIIRQLRAAIAEGGRVVQDEPDDDLD